MKELRELRGEIDAIDTELVKLFEQRMEVSRQVAETKMERGLAVLNREREQEVLNRVASKAEPGLRDSTRCLYEFIMTLSRQYQQKLMDLQIKLPSYTGGKQEYPALVTYQGVEGAYSEEALREFFGEEVTAVHVDSFAEVLENLETGNSRYGILPIENSSTGSINDVYTLLQQYDCYIVGEYKLSISHCLVGTRDCRIGDIKEVYSHDQGLLQCSHFLNQYPQMKRIPYYNTAMSAQMVAQCGDKTKAAIASRRSAKKYGLRVIEENISNSDNNYTNFIIVSKQFEGSPENDKISAALTLKHEVGSLYKLLTLFYINGANLLKLESRPLSGRPFEYCFFVDFEGNISDQNIKTLINSILEHASSFKLLGNYKKMS